MHLRPIRRSFGIGALGRIRAGVQSSVRLSARNKLLAKRAVSGQWPRWERWTGMNKCLWVRPELDQLPSLEWTDNLSHSKFAGLRDDKDARSVVGNFQLRRRFEEGEYYYRT